MLGWLETGPNQQVISTGYVFKCFACSSSGHHATLLTPGPDVENLKKTRRVEKGNFATNSKSFSESVAAFTKVCSLAPAACEKDATSFQMAAAEWKEGQEDRQCRCRP